VIHPVPPETRRRQPVIAGGGRAGPAIALDRIAKRFADGTVAVADVSLHVAAGELVAIVGPSGCGKSTLLRLVSALERPTSGELRTRTDQLAYVFQDPTLLPWRTVQENVELLGELHGIERGERRRRAAEAIALTGLTGFERHRPRQLSGGMRMRVSLARSLTLQPRAFLFDEPFGALDELTRERMNAELLELFARERFAALFVTHSVSEAVFLASRVLVMSSRPGRIVGEFAVPFGYPRDPALRFDPSFAAIAAAVSARLREAQA
jgi:NitT/TauT family transport system ATP-binding protein